MTGDIFRKGPSGSAPPPTGNRLDTITWALAEKARLQALADVNEARVEYLTGLMSALNVDPFMFRPARVPRLWRSAIGALRGEGDEATAEMAERATLFYATAPMAQLAETAVKDLPEAHLGRDLWPSEVGFLLFEQPVVVRGAIAVAKAAEVLATRTPVRALVWGPSEDGIKVSMLADLTAVATMVWDAASPGDRSAPGWGDDLMRHMLRQREQHGLLAPVAHATYPLDRPVAADSDREEPHLALLLSTIWLLMQEPHVVEESTQECDPKTARKLRRAGRPAPTVRLIDLRRAPGARRIEGDPTREFHHRWYVRGHWRRQWYPSVQMHRPKWIRPHTKGPDGAPLLTGDKVNVWKR